MEDLAKFEKPTDDYLRVATASPEVAIADAATNAERITEAYEAAKNEQAELVVFPELAVTGYSTADLFHNQHVLEQSERGLEALARITEAGPAMLVGAPLRHNDLIYNCAVMLAEGRVQGVVPKSHLPNAKEFYERRWFTSGDRTLDQTIAVADQEVPFGTDLMWDINGAKVAAEVCEDMFAPIPPATYAALAGAQVVANLSASNELIGKADYRKVLISGFTGRNVCGYVYSSVGQGESVADVIYGGHQIVAENGHIPAERPPLSDDQTPLLYDIDRTYIEHDRYENKTFADQAKQQQAGGHVRLTKLSVPGGSGDLLRHVDPLPFVPKNPETLDERCEEIFAYVSSALAQRVKEKNTKAIVLGVSGGLDSTLALLVALDATKRLDKPTDFIHTITMPARASSERTQDNATDLARAMGTEHKTIPVQDLAGDMLGAIGHNGEDQDVTYENSQARVRTSILMNYANLVGGMVEGTGDMSENAIGWCTYNGDQMSMYNPNGGIPKTLVQHLVRWYAENRTESPVRDTLLDILETPISPELTGEGDLSQKTEDEVGPYEITDFCLYEMIRRGSRPSKIGYLALQAFEGKYDEQTINEWLDKFLDRFIGSQWKREAMPNTIKTGTVSESPRGDWRMAPNVSRSWTNLVKITA